MARSFSADSASWDAPMRSSNTEANSLRSPPPTCNIRTEIQKSFKGRRVIEKKIKNIHKKETFSAIEASSFKSESFSRTPGSCLADRAKSRRTYTIKPWKPKNHKKKKPKKKKEKENSSIREYRLVQKTALRRPRRPWHQTPSAERAERRLSAMRIRNKESDRVG